MGCFEARYASLCQIIVNYPLKNKTKQIPFQLSFDLFDAGGYTLVWYIVNKLLISVSVNNWVLVNTNSVNLVFQAIWLVRYLGPSNITHFLGSG